VSHSRELPFTQHPPTPLPCLAILVFCAAFVTPLAQFQSHNEVQQHATIDGLARELGIALWWPLHYPEKEATCWARDTTSACECKKKLPKKEVMRGSALEANLCIRTR